MNKIKDVKRIVFVMSDTGHGHRAAATAISTALKMRYGDAVECETVDVFKCYTPFPFRNFPEYYPKIVQRTSPLYSMAYKLSNTPRRARLFARALHMMSYGQLRRLATDYPADAIVSTHSIITRPSFTALSRLEKRPLLFTVVVDLVSTHMFWYDNRSDLLLLPTQPAYENGIKAGIQAEKMQVVGMPVHPDFNNTTVSDKAGLRQRLNWEADMPTVLLTGGGDGMRRLYKIATHINDSKLPLQLIIITGRNAALKAALEKIKWHYPAQIYGFVPNMYELMAASDLLLTKAGSLTISEACVMGLPMLLYEALPGQEEGNLDYVVEGGAGMYAPSTKTIVRRLRQLMFEDCTMLHTCALNARKISYPQAAWDIAEIIWRNLQPG